MALHIVTAKALRYRCNICGLRFYEDEEARWTAHVVKCARVNDHLTRQSLRHKAPGIFDPHDERTRDLELQAWVDRNREAIIEYRRKV